MNAASPNPLAVRIQQVIAAHFPDWESHLQEGEEGDIEIAVPAPRGSKAGSLVVATENGSDLWIRFSPPYMAYAVDDEVELLDIVKQILDERASFAVITEGEQWKETTLLLPNEIPELQPGQQARIVSWLGTYDREVA